MDVPNDYDPTGRGGRRPHPRRSRYSEVKPKEPEDLPVDVRQPLVFGRKIEPPSDTLELPPICVTGCRLGECTGPCRLMARNDKKEPRWTTPTTTTS